MHIIRFLPPEALTVIVTAIAAAILIIIFGLAGKFRRIKVAAADAATPAWQTYYGLDGSPFEMEVVETDR